jgi:hypothetical protein
MAIGNVRVVAKGIKKSIIFVKSADKKYNNLNTDFSLHHLGTKNIEGEMNKKQLIVAWAKE